jgi:1,4-alpha-glucan branching enzyme
LGAFGKKSVSVIGDFNYWIQKDNINYKCVGIASGIWEGFIPGMLKKALAINIKFYQTTTDITTEKADPFALYCEKPPQTASIIWDLDYKWKDASYG